MRLGLEETTPLPTAKSWFCHGLASSAALSFAKSLTAFSTAPLSYPKSLTLLTAFKYSHVARGINTTIMADRLDDVAGDQTGSSDELSQILGLYGDQEAAGG